MNYFFEYNILLLLFKTITLNYSIQYKSAQHANLLNVPFLWYVIIIIIIFNHLRF